MVRLWAYLPEPANGSVVLCPYGGEEDPDIAYQRRDDWAIDDSLKGVLPAERWYCIGMTDISASWEEIEEHATLVYNSSPPPPPPPGDQELLF